MNPGYGQIFGQFEIGVDHTNTRVIPFSQITIDNTAIDLTGQLELEVINAR